MWDIVGHQRVVEVLQRAIDADRLPHALLLTGAEGIGKTRLALELAKALNCVGAEPPCGVCIHCHQIGLGTHPDVTVVERQDGKDSIAIQQVRELRDVAWLRPFQGKRKVYIVADAEGLTAQAADALLKTLEEPQRLLTLVLTAPEDDALPATVVSRCRVMVMQPVPPDVIASLLVQNGQDGVTAKRLARLARGSVGWAVRAAKQPKLVVQQEELVRRLSEVLDLNLDARLRLVESLTSERKDRAGVRRTIELLVLLARDVLYMAQGLAPHLAVGSEQEVLDRQAGRLSLQQIHGYLRALRLAMERIDSNVDPRLTLEALMVSAP